MECYMDVIYIIYWYDSNVTLYKFLLPPSSSFFFCKIKKKLSTSIPPTNDAVKLFTFSLDLFSPSPFTDWYGGWYLIAYVLKEFIIVMAEAQKYILQC